jgi:hypothetical protein
LICVELEHGDRKLTLKDIKNKIAKSSEKAIIPKIRFFSYIGTLLQICDLSGGMGLAEAKRKYFKNPDPNG